MRLNRVKYIYCALLLVMVYFFFGVGDYMQTKSFAQNFDYPLDVDIKPLIQGILDGNPPQTPPINIYPFKYLLSPPTKCSEQPDLVILVKSALNHFEQRAAIRRTWGSETQFPELKIKTFFFLGTEENESDVQSKVREEDSRFGDIVQCDFVDNYYNNTIKTMMMFRWVYEHCRGSEHYFFSDDDMYVSVHNLLEYIKDPLSYLTTDDGRLESNESVIFRDLFAGYVFKSSPHRYMASKWRVSLEQYPWDMWPPYVTAGAYVVSNAIMKRLYLGSLFVKHFHFDDIYLGIVAKKAGVTLSHCSEFYFYKKPYRVVNYKHVIASHGYGFHKELLDVWSAQREMGCA